MTKKFCIDERLTTLAHAQRVERKLREEHRRDPRVLNVEYAKERFYTREGMNQ